MPSLRILIVDDEKKVRNTLRNLIKLHYHKADVIGEAEDVNSAADAIREHEPDLILLDIKMPGGTGFDLLKQYNPIPFKVIFITAFNDFAVQAFRFSAIDYLLKPVIPDELVNALQRVEQEIDKENLMLRYNVLMENLKRDNKKIVLNSADSMQIVLINDIIRCEADRNYTRIYIHNKNNILISKNLKEFDEMLSPSGFLRVHHSHLVNPDYIEKLDKKDGGTLIMKDSTGVPVSTRKYSDILAWFNKI
ncbi:MAG: hypothetical protein A2275_00705 [Bacteroidetes bacterium RIFOXYA12_FULL_35_11]|nr:MAG: hypothetical protein A2X01_20935 [Bacteroidetes bacterium GWF2_35_48]OFY82079.1 MAG: hypothetical protein A2275_00705 [Bacteroidetes bacterium RIFOXYA12_FULL_35_11]OFY97535.1 MAG: hypothetical protein A2309_06610 [Bacteroidetes bacterium RIFOXYB2_FULL_35_7]HBX51381.1 DNA-binding response regulator [Bacteroidales bacterium]